jgi:hypothetical protein
MGFVSFIRDRTWLRKPYFGIGKWRGAVLNGFGFDSCR